MLDNVIVSDNSHYNYLAINCVDTVPRGIRQTGILGSALFRQQFNCWRNVGSTAGGTL
jgi:hypothetical protein